MSETLCAAAGWYHLAHPGSW